MFLSKTNKIEIVLWRTDEGNTTEIFFLYFFWVYLWRSCYSISWAYVAMYSHSVGLLLTSNFCYVAFSRLITFHFHICIYSHRKTIWNICLAWECEAYWLAHIRRAFAILSTIGNRNNCLFLYVRNLHVSVSTVGIEGCNFVHLNAHRHKEFICALAFVTRDHPRARRGIADRSRGMARGMDMSFSSCCHFVCVLYSIFVYRCSCLRLFVGF